MTGFLQFTGVILGALLVLLGAVRATRPSAPEGRSASASEVRELGVRLDSQATRIENLEKRQRGLYTYIADDHDQHRSQNWPIIPLPQDLA